VTRVVRALGVLLCALLFGVGAAACGTSGDGGRADGTTSAQQSASSAQQSTNTKPGGKSTSASPQADVPQRVRDTLAHIDAGDWPDAAHAPGTHGGDPFGNREGRLPTTNPQGAAVRYREWDVNPKKKGQGRDAERIITGDDGSAWYTLDHYDHFSRIR